MSAGTTPSLQERRKSIRFPLDVPCRVTLRQGKGTSVEAALIDISADGAKLVSPIRLPDKSSIGIQLLSCPECVLNGHIAWERPPVEEGYQVGVRLDGSWPYQVFVELSSQAMSANLYAPAVAVETSESKCWNILGIQPPCTVRDVEHAYYQLARTTHPDRGGNVESFVTVHQAYREALRALNAL